MIKKQMKKGAYIAPRIRVIPLCNDYSLLASSPNAQPGGGSGGNISVNPLDPDEEEEVSGAKPWKLWEYEEEE